MTDRYYYHGTCTGKEKHLMGVYFTPSPQEAIGYAYENSSKIGGDPLVVVLDLEQNCHIQFNPGMTSDVHISPLGGLEGLNIMKEFRKFPLITKDDFEKDIFSEHYKLMGFDEQNSQLLIAQGIRV